MSPANLPPAQLIEEPQALQDLAHLLSNASQVAVDTESNSLYAYREQVCLIQFSIPEGDYLVDPLGGLDLEPLAPVFANPQIEKIFHAAEYDVICLRRDFHFSFANLFDTMLAARILGRGELGLGSLLQVEFGVQLDKRHQRADWGKRPLPQDMISYARLDTHYLLELRERLYTPLVKTERWALAAEDFQRLCALNGNGRSGSDDPMEGCFRISGVQELSPEQLAVLVELCRYRDRLARQRDMPLFKVFSDRSLLELAQMLPSAPHELRRVHGISPRLVDRYGSALIQAVRKGLSNPPVRLPRQPRPDDAYLHRLDALRQWRKVTGLKLSMASDVVLPRDLMYAVAERNPRLPQELAEVLQDSPYRLERFGAQILKTIGRR